MFIHHEDMAHCPSFDIHTDIMVVSNRELALEQQ